MQFTVHSQVKTLCDLRPRYYWLPTDPANQADCDPAIVERNDEPLLVVKYTHLVKELFLDEVAVFLNYLEIIRRQRLQLNLLKFFEAVFNSSLHQVSIIEAQ